MDERIISFAPVKGAQPELTDEQSGRSFIPVNEFCTEFDWNGGESAVCVNAPPDAITRFQHEYRFARFHEVLCGG